MKHRASKSTSPTKGKGGRGAGKGKGAASASSSSSGSSSSGAFDLKDIPLQLPSLTSSEDLHCEWVPRFHAVLKRSESDGVGLEDLDTLQLELEAMLAAVVVKRNSLSDEIAVLKDVDKYKSSSSSSKRGSTAASPERSGSGGGKRGQSAASTSSSATPSTSAKKFKSSSGKPVELGKMIGLPKVKSEQAIPAFDPLQNEQIRATPEPPKVQLPKNETPNRFWAFVEPYCAPIAVDDIKLLEDLIRTHNDMSEYYRVPPLGQHYTQRWAKEDLENERQKSSGGSGNEDSNGPAKMLKKGDSFNGSNDEESTPYGELTQRLVGGLMEENIMTSTEESMDATRGRGGSGSETEDKSNLIKSLNINNAEALEARVKKELEEQGLLSPDGGDDDKEDNDEILEELKRCQSELKAVSSHNVAQLNRLLKAAKEEMIRQELRNRLQEADKEVMDAYQKISSARSKKKAPTKKERDQAWKALKEREIILKELENV